MYLQKLLGESQTPRLKIPARFFSIDFYFKSLKNFAYIKKRAYSKKLN